MATDTEILDWIQKNVTYLEHGREPDGYWPQSQDDSAAGYRYDLCDLNLRDYVTALIEEGQ